jgi:hypothetical protein
MAREAHGMSAAANALLSICVLGVVALALVLDLATLLAWAKRVTEQKFERPSKGEFAKK